MGQDQDVKNSRNNRVLSYSPKRNKAYPHRDKASLPDSRNANPLRFAFYPKENMQNAGDSDNTARTRKLLATRNFSPP